jgi:hypothetical protein
VDLLYSMSRFLVMCSLGIGFQEPWPASAKVGLLKRWGRSIPKLLSDFVLQLYGIEKDVVYMVTTVYCDR